MDEVGDDAVYGDWNKFGDYSARVNERRTSMLDIEDFERGVPIKVMHSGGRLYPMTLTVKGEPDVGPYTRVWFTKGEEAFLHEDILSAVAGALGRGMMPIPVWSKPNTIENEVL